MTGPVRVDAVLPAPPLTWRGAPLDVHDLAPLWAGARRSAAGQGPTTRFDPAVRDAWELDADDLDGLDEPAWQRALQQVLDDAADTLGLGGPVVPRFDKLVLYGPDGHFVPHRDTLRGHGHVATLLVRLRTASAGGRLWVGAHRPVVDGPAPADGVVVATVFHTDVPHRIEPVDEGARVALVYQVHRQGPPGPSQEASATAHPVGHTDDGGEVALLAHHYSEEALRAGALVGDDRRLLARWAAEDPDVRVVLGRLDAQFREEYVGELTVALRPLHPTPDDARISVRPTPLLAGALEEHDAPGGYRMWTGNEGTEHVQRYVAAAAVRWPGPVLDEPPANVRATLAAADRVAQEVVRVLDHQLPALQQLAARLRDAAWHADLPAQAAADVAEAAIREEVHRWYEQVRQLATPLSYAVFGPVVEGDEFAEDPVLQASAGAWAAHAEAQGWRVLSGALTEAASPSLWSTAHEVVIDTWTPAHGARLAGTPTRRVTVHDGPTTPAHPFPAMPLLQELTASDRMTWALDLDQTPALRQLTLRGTVRRSATAAQQTLFGPDPTAGGLVRVDLRTRGAVPPAVVGPALRTLRIRADDDQPLELGALHGATGLRRLDLDGVVSLDGLPWARLAALTHLRIRRRPGAPQLALPTAAQFVLERLEALQLEGVGLGEVRLRSATSLHTLHLDTCTEVHAPLPAGRLRSLRVVATAVALPVELPLLESLHVEGPDRTFELVLPPRLRHLRLAHLHHAELTDLVAAAELRHLTLEGIDHLHLPTAPVLPRLESLTLRRLPLAELPVHGPRLRALTVDDLPVPVLPDGPWPALSSVSLVDLPLAALPDGWAHSPLAELTLNQLPHLAALPSWLSRCHTLQRLEARRGALTRLPSLACLHELAVLDLCAQPLEVDDAFAATLRAAPALTQVWLTWPGMDGPTPNLHRQLHAVGYRPPAAPPPPDDGDDDIPF